MANTIKIEDDKKVNKGLAMKRFIWNELDLIARDQKRSRNNLIAAILEEYVEREKGGQRSIFQG